MTAPATESPRTVVMSNRRRSLGFAVFFGILTFASVARELASHSTVGVILALAFFGAPFAFFLGWGTRRRPVLVIDQHGLTEGRSGRTVPWEVVATARVAAERGLFGESHHLVLCLDHDAAPSAPRRFITTNVNNPDELDINLDLLAMPWSEVVSAVEQRSGRRVVRANRRQ